jgi:hypothetical protein
VHGAFAERGANPDDFIDAAFVTGLLLAFALALGSAAAVAYWRRGGLSGTEIGCYWLGCALTSAVALPFVFALKDWNWLSTGQDGTFGTGALLAFALALGTAAALAYRRREQLSGAEVGAYWLGCTLLSILPLGLVFSVNEWNWLGLDEVDADFATGSIFALMLAIGSAATLAYRRGVSLTAAEIAFYWLGCTVALSVASILLCQVNQWPWAGTGAPSRLRTGLLIALAIAAASAVVLVSWWRAARRHNAPASNVRAT